ncbi:MAG: ABC transporter permease [Gammaproteobacteria bacterium]|nr:ABC transporter permease [Gammaproteobacteria bacterium]MBU2059251.1 ABC transporter permease [Gammaproteobacteria bacterium]MBU2176789.1 ABC transporter permease [Gammaproteobacteria bacterium]MBU2246634.1 ABC transporter permease [Gammaproteobacteria bacterium]MBU2344402.1 ABC transporter permease [Gammaproteobacteria bacterium]
MIWPLMVNELKFYVRQPLCWLAVVLSCAFVFLLAAGLPGSAEQNPLKQLLFACSAVAMLVLPLLTGVLAPLAFLREQQSGMTELIRATPVSHFGWCLSRTAGLLLLCIVMTLLLSGVLLFGLWRADAVPFDQELIGTFLAIFLLQYMPALLLLCLLQLWLSLKFGSVVLLYVAALLLWAGYMALAAGTGSPLMANSQIVTPWLWQLMLYSDFYAITPLLQQFMTGQQTLQLDLTFILNRLVLLCACALLWWCSIRIKISDAAAAKSAMKPVVTSENSASTSSLFRAVPVQHSAFYALWQLTTLNIRQLMLHPGSWLSLVGLAALAFSEVVSGADYAEVMSVLTPTSRDALNQVMWDLVPRCGALLLLFWTTKLSWLNKSCDMHELVASTAVSGRMLLFSQLLCMTVMLSVFIALMLTAVMAAQLCVTSAPLLWSEYLLQAGYQWGPLWLLMLLCVSLHSLCRHALLALVLIVLVLALHMSPLPMMLGLEHPLWLLFATPLHAADELWGYQSSSAGFWPFIVFWFLLVLIPLTLALVFYHRGTGFSGPVLRAGFTPKLISALLFVLIGGSWQGWQLDHQLSAEQPLIHSFERLQWRANYETEYQHWQHKPQPVVTAVYSEVDFEPAEQSARLKLVFTLSNTTTEPIQQVLVGQHWAYPLQQIELTGAKLSRENRQLGQREFTFTSPLLPGQNRSLTVQLQLKQSGLWPAAMHQLIRPDFSYLRSVPLFPTVGFVPEYRIRDNNTRTEYGLPKLTAQKPSEASTENAAYQWVKMESVISVPVGQEAITQGALVKQWQQHGRSFFHYRTSRPLRAISAFVVVPWQKKQLQHGKVLLEIYAPEQNQSTELTMLAMQQTLSWFEQQISPYRGDVLRLVSMPELDSGGTGYALPQLVLINHRVGVRATQAADAGFSQVYRRAVHEVAHQWFGHDMGNGVPGDGVFLVESLAKYVELVLIEQHFGRDAMVALVGYEKERFARAQARSKSQPSSLIDSDESYDQYSRATLVFARLRAELGDQLITAALRQLWSRHGYPNTPASSMDFVRQLKAVSPVEKHGLIEQLLLGESIEGLL